MASEPTFTTTNDGRHLETQVEFNADAPLTLSTSNASGSVTVATDPSLPSGTIRVVATRTDGGDFEPDDHHFTVKTDGNTISIHPDWQFASGVSGLARRLRDQLQHGFRPEDWNLSRLRLSPELDFNIAVSLPAGLAAGSQVKIRTASGAVRARDFSAGASIVTASGDVEARQLTGTIAIHTASGDVEADEITESLEINTASGDVTIRGGDAWLAARSASGDVAIRGTRLRNARITTVSGDADIDAVLDNAASYNCETVSGDVTINATLPGSDARATLGFGTLSGSSDVGPAWDKQKRREWTAGAGESGPTVNVKTVSGDLSAHARLEPGVTARALAIPTPAGGSAESEGMDEFRREMEEFGREMKHFGTEMKHMAGMGHTPPAPPTPPTPPHDAQDGHVHDREERRAERQAEREQRQAEREERREERRQGADDASPLFTAGPSGVDYRRDTAQPTEPVAPPQPFTDAPAPSEGEPDATSETAPLPETASEDPRLRVLEALEKGEIDIEAALAQLDDRNDRPQG